MKSSARMQSRYDVVVVGARVAGAGSALLLARAGLSVLAVEKTLYGSDTTSTLALMRGGVMQLRRWGVLDRIVAAKTPAMRRTTFQYGDEAIAVDIQPRDGVDALYSPRRTVLDVALVDVAREAGAHVVHGAIVNRLLRDDSGRVGGAVFTDAAGVTHSVKAGMVVGADGARSRVADAVSAEVLHQGRGFGAAIYGYYHGLGLDETRWYYNDGVAAGVIPTNGDMACVFVAMPPERYRARDDIGFDALFMDVLRDTDATLAEQIVGGERVGKLHPFAGRAGHIRRSWGPGWALVGDASCFKDPITAHGMTDAMRDAELLANAIIAGSDESLAAYQSVRDDFAVEFLDLTDRIASFDWDLDTVKPMHRRLSKLMSAECDIIRGFDSTGESSSSIVAGG